MHLGSASHLQPVDHAVKCRLDTVALRLGLSADLPTEHYCIFSISLSFRFVKSFSQKSKGAHGYRDRKYFSCISVHYNGREDMGVWVEMSGQGCRTFESLSAKSWDDLFGWIAIQQLKITRLDVAFDDHTGILDIDEVVEDTRRKHYVSRSDYWETVLSSKGSTVQIGSPQSKVLVRIYDKAAERHCEPGTHWVRVEMQLRDDRAL